MYDFYLFVCIVLGDLDVAVEALNFRVMHVYTMICDIDDQSLDSFFFFFQIVNTLWKEGDLWSISPKL